MNSKTTWQIAITNITVVLFMLAFSITGCKSSSPSIFFSQICSPPCWESIQPGVTTKQQAYDLLSQNSIINKDTIAFRGAPNWIFDDELYFDIKTRETGGSIHIIDNKVVGITFSGDLGITLGETFEKIGEPEYVIDIPQYGGPPLNGFMGPVLQLINSQVGYGLIYDPRGLTPTMYYKISPDSVPTTLIYFYPQIFDQLVNAGFFSFETLNGDQTRKNFIPWNGYGDLKQKYPEVNNGS